MKRIAILLLTALCLFGCSASGKKDKDTLPEDAVSSQGDISAVEALATTDAGEGVSAEEEMPSPPAPTKVQGAALETLGYRIDRPRGIGLKNPNGDGEWQTFCLIATCEQDSAKSPAVGKILGEYTLVAAQAPGRKPEDCVAIAYLQAFHTADLEAGNVEISVNGQFYSPEELKEDICWKDDKITVYDLTNLVESESFRVRLAAFQTNGGAPADLAWDYSWLEDMNAVFRSSMPQWIHGSPGGASSAVTSTTESEGAVS